LVPLDLQLYMFCVLVLAGIGLGLVFDLYRVFRGLTRPKGYVVGLEDLLFWLVVLVFLFGALIVGNWGELRLYVFVALALGLVLYWHLASAAVIAGMMHTYRFAERACKGVLKFMRQVVVIPVGFVLRKVRFFYDTVRRPARSLMRRFRVFAWSWAPLRPVRELKRRFRRFLGRFSRR